MIKLQRIDLEQSLQQRLADLTSQIKARRRSPAQQIEYARYQWRSRRAVRTALKGALAGFAAGRDRCMYCGDNEGTDIDHFDPLARTPVLTFTWTNHLLACSTCNSHYKRDGFPVTPAGRPLLLDPTVDDPFEHLALALSIGRYAARTERGQATIDICGLNRDLLTRGRQAAFALTSEMIHAWHTTVDAGNTVRAEGLLRTLKEQPFADVTHAMLRYCDLPGAVTVFGDHAYVLPILQTTGLKPALTS